MLTKRVLSQLISTKILPSSNIKQTVREKFLVQSSSFSSNWSRVLFLFRMRGQTGKLILIWENICLKYFQGKGWCIKKYNIKAAVANLLKIICHKMLTFSNKNAFFSEIQGICSWSAQESVYQNPNHILMLESIIKQFGQKCILNISPATCHTDAVQCSV